MPAVLAAGTYVRDPSTGDPVYFAAGATPPDWAQQLILNPANWVGGVAPYSAPDAAVPVQTNKAAVRAATTANITLSGLQTVDGVALASGDRVLVKNQTTGSQNGIYAVKSGAWARASDANSGTGLVGATVYVTEGATNADKAFSVTTDAPITLDSTVIAWQQVGGGSDPTALKIANNLSDVASAATARSNLGAGSALIAAAVKTSAYTATAGDLVPVDTTSGVVTITLPSAPADGTKVAVKHVIQGGTNAVTVACGGTDVFNKAGGSTSLSLPLLNQTVSLQYKASGGIWYVVADDMPLGNLDARYAPIPLVQSKTASFLATTGGVYEVDCTSGNVTATVPNTAGSACTIKRMDASANTLSVAAVSGTVDGQASLSLVKQYEARQFVGDGTNVVAVAERRASDVQTFASSGTWTKPSNPLLQFAAVRVIAGGGGGGAGRRGAAGTVRCGGGGGGGGGDTGWVMIPLSVLGSSETVTVGAGGSGGAAQTVDSSDGASGGGGGGGAFGLHLRAASGGAGSGGTATAGTGGSVGGSFWSGTAGAAASTTGTVGNNATAATNGAATGGGSGGGITSGDAVSAGGTGGFHNALISSGTNSRAGGAGGASPGGAGQVAAVVNGVNEILPGNGGGGGGSSITGAGGAGGAGSRFGAAGGGGGASLNGNNSGAGGSGADGVVQVVCW